MRESQFEEIVFWLSGIAALLAYNNDFIILSKVLLAWCLFNLWCASKEARKELKEEKNEHPNNP